LILYDYGGKFFAVHIGKFAAYSMFEDAGSSSLRNIGKSVILKEISSALKGECYGYFIAFR
jgi:hypothetical protein